MPMMSQFLLCQFKGTATRKMLCKKEIEHSSVFDHQSLLLHSREVADSGIWKSAVHSRSETMLYKPVSSSEEAVDPWADEQRELRWRATVCVLCGPATQ